ncbi:MAG: phage terminase large subunit [Nitrosarchaeum sp.]|nr:phage terminase large subunit [Nitrosarchaeum sp.]
MERALCEENLSFFTRKVLKILEPKRKYIPNWHIEYICEHLEVLGQDFNRLMINIAPEHMKSMICTISYPCREWIENPHLRFGFSSYSQPLSTSFNLKRRSVIESDFFKEHWGDRFQLTDDQNQKTQFENSKRGLFFATSTTGTSGGFHFDRVIVDDPQNPLKAFSEADRVKANEHVDYMFNTRLMEDGQGILIMQRLHHLDACAKVLNDMKINLENYGQDVDKWHCLVLPAVAPEKKVYSFPKSNKERIVRQGEMLWPERFSERDINAKKQGLGPLGFSAQYMQRPTPAGGNFVKREWWKRYVVPPVFRSTGWFLDTATKDKQENDFTVAILIGETATGFYILDCVKRHIKAALLEQFIDDLWAKSNANVLSVEDKDSGQRLIQYLQQNRNYPVRAYKPEGDKVYRLSLVAPYVASGRVHIPENAPWLFDFLDEMDQFPKGAHDDQVDAFTQGILYFTGGGLGSTLGEAPKKTINNYIPPLTTKDLW